MVKKCLICKNEFEPKQNKQKYCESCGKEAKRQLIKRRVQKLRLQKFIKKGQKQTVEKAKEISETNKEWLYPKQTQKIKEMVEIAKKHGVPIYLIEPKTKQIIKPTSDLCLKILHKLTSSGDYWTWLTKQLSENKETRETYHIASCPFCQLVYAKSKSGALFHIEFWNEPLEDTTKNIQKQAEDIMKEEFGDYT